MEVFKIMCVVDTNYNVEARMYCIHFSKDVYGQTVCEIHPLQGGLLYFLQTMNTCLWHKTEIENFKEPGYFSVTAGNR
jgi:hypothetical protein